MVRVAIILVLSFLVNALASNQNLKFTNNNKFLLKQAFVYQILWDPEELSLYHNETIKKARDFKVNDLRKLPVNQVNELCKIVVRDFFLIQMCVF